MMFTDHGAAVEEADYLANKDGSEVVVVTNEDAECLWVISAKQLNKIAYKNMEVLERFKPWV
tara:strand:+ start:1993 stop:2178 length:186 start_codon:yes stop_codon:yes gene_type:complete